jgi:hypothetical protein
MKHKLNKQPKVKNNFKALCQNKMKTLNFNIGFPASSISAVAGRHKHKHFKRALAEILHKYNGHLIPQETDFVRKLPEEFADELILELIQENRVHHLPVIEERSFEDLIHENKLRYDIIIEVNKKIENLNINISEDLKKRIIDHAWSALDRNRGTVLEHITLRKLQEQGLKVTKPNYQFSKKFGFKHCHNIFGKVDGIILDESGLHVQSVVEIKNRKSNFFRPEYDIDQLAVYMFLTGAQEGILVEQLNGEIRKTFYSRETMLERWLDIIYCLKNAISLARKIQKEKIRNSLCKKNWETLVPLFVNIKKN